MLLYNNCSCERDYKDVSSFVQIPSCREIQGLCFYANVLSKLWTLMGALLGFAI